MSHDVWFKDERCCVFPQWSFLATWNDRQRHTAMVNNNG